MTDLKPCPFCGSDNVFVQCMVYMLEGYERHYVECYDCGADVGVIKNPNGTFGAFYETKQQAIDAWNTRAERTCKLDKNRNCSVCGAYIETITHAVYEMGDMFACSPRYCPSCGAKVVDE